MAFEEETRKEIGGGGDEDVAMEYGKDEWFRERTEVVEASKKLQERRLQWYGHVMRRGEGHVLREMMNLQVSGKRPRGRPRRWWKDCIADDLRENQLRPDDARDRIEWRRRVRNSDPYQLGIS